MGKLKKVLLEQLLKLCETFFTLVRTLVIILLLSSLIWICGGRPDIYKSFQKTLQDIVVIRLEPRGNLYTQYPNEYSIGKYGDAAQIPNGKILTIDELEKPIWIGIKNNENVSLENVLFKIYLPPGVMLINEERWKSGWREFDVDTGKGFFTQFKDNIQPERGSHFDPPLQVKFPKAGDYYISYIYFCDNFMPKKGHFIIRVLAEAEKR